jgi:hypothetical protein
MQRTVITAGQSEEDVQNASDHSGFTGEQSL